MKKFKKLNRKGFTLIELLAVIVILAIIMTIATTSVLNSMNESRKKSLLNSASSAADAFNTAYADNMLANKTEVLGISGLLDASSYPVAKNLSGAATDLGISSNDYIFGDATIVTDKITATGSFVAFDGSKFLVCMVAKDGGTLYLASAKSSTTKNANNFSSRSVEMPAGMWACSDGTHSWT